MEWSGTDLLEGSLLVENLLSRGELTENLRSEKLILAASAYAM